MLATSRLVAAAAETPPVETRSVLEVDAGVAMPSAFAGLRKILLCVEAAAPEVVRALAEKRPAEWNRLFPGAIHGAPDLSDLALTPSERRLHRESEQIYWILNLAAHAIVEGVRATGKPLLVRGAGECDLVSLRALMRAQEWGRLEGLGNVVSFGATSLERMHATPLFEARRRAYLETLCARMRLPSLTSTVAPAARTPEPGPDLESRYLAATVDAERAPEERIAAAVLAMRSCFFTTNYEGALLAAEHGLAQLDVLGEALSPSRVLDAWDALDTRFTTPAIEVDRDSLGDRHELRALLERSVGVVHVFTGEHDAGLEAFARGLACAVSPERLGQLRMFRALTFIKRFGHIPRARVEIDAGLAGLEGRNTTFRSLHEGWLRNVSALTYFQEKKLDLALQEEKLAMKCVGDLHDASATHLKINLISNTSVLQETARLYEASITTWRRFEKVSEKWGDNFQKHHKYRLAGLELAQGNRDASVGHYGNAYDAAEKLGDPLHRQVIAAELGRLHLDDATPEVATQWFTRAVSHARELGDPFRLAESLVGLALAQGSSDWSEPVRLVKESSTYPREQAALLAALVSGEAQAVKAVLPKPRSKLNRPFDQVNL